MLVQFPEFCLNLPDLLRTVEMIQRVNSENSKTKLDYEIMCGPDDLVTEGERMVLITGHPAAISFLKIKLKLGQAAMSQFENILEQSPQDIDSDLRRGESSRPSKPVRIRKESSNPFDPKMGFLGMLRLPPEGML